MKSGVIYIFIGIIAICLALSIPLLFPYHNPTVSMSFDVGFNNKVGLIILIIFSLFFVAAGFFSHNSEKEECIKLLNKKTQISNKVTICTISVTCLFFFLYCLFCSPYILYMGEGSYFTLHVYDTLMGLRPYEDFVYYYGPFSIYFPLIISKILPFLSIESSYVISLALTQIVCLYITKDILNYFNLQLKDKQIIYILIAISFFPYSMGYNSCLLRYVLSPWIILKIIELTKRKDDVFRLICFVIISSIVTFLVSPEIWLIYNFCLILYLLVDGVIQKNHTNYYICLVTLIIFTSFFKSFPSIFTVIADFSSGCNNFPFVPSIAFIFFTISIFIIAFNIGIKFKHIISNYRLLFFLLSCLSTIPAALGRTDTIHIVYNGWLVVLIAYVIISSKYHWAKKWSLVLTIIFFLSHVPFNLYSYGRIYYKEFLANTREKYPILSNLIKIASDPRIKKIVDSKKKLPFTFSDKDKVTMPIMTNSFYYLQLRRKGIYKNLYFSRIWFSATDKNINRTISDIKKQNIDYIILPSDWKNYELVDNKYNTLLFLCPPVFKVRYNGNIVYKKLVEYIEKEYYLVDQSQGWMKYKKRIL